MSEHEMAMYVVANAIKPENGWKYTDPFTVTVYRLLHGSFPFMSSASTVLQTLDPLLSGQGSIHQTHTAEPPAAPLADRDQDRDRHGGDRGQHS
ncbi:uncharacterized protein V6R79_002160 [Siganus canaliculatus]